MKLFRTFLLLAVFLSCGFPLLAQQLEGTVGESDGDALLPAVIVNNKTKGQSTMSDADGKYSIAAGKGDEIEFSYLGYYPVSFIMPDEATVFRRVTLRKKLISLQEIEIRPDLTPYQMDSLRRRQSYALDLNRQKASSTVLGTIFSPASALAEQFSKKTKQRTRFQHHFAEWEQQKFVDTRYTPEEVQKLTGLTGDTLAAFINAHPMPYDYARAATDLEVKMWIRYNYREWIKKPIVLPSPIPADTTRQPDPLNKE